ncbi:coiled-coil domain-containing protein 7 [Sarcoptes scabiei]|uniref:Coiled-coil domain-containing protein 7 n=1 Tax=Sarcoptes scabiei TaxID=52283 RepID=A0A131ZYF7_SARSC|nr:coiled-coil domain-containing protein 7 [Sarcoptes scabiei]
MDVGKNKLKSIIKQVQNSTELLIKKSDTKSNHPTINSISSEDSIQLDLPSAIEYNYCLINSYLQERSQRQRSSQEEVLTNCDDNDDVDEESILQSISKEFFLDPKSLDSNQTDCDVSKDIDRNNNNHQNRLDGQSKILEMCVLKNLPKSNDDQNRCELGDDLLRHIDAQRKILQRQQLIVSKRLIENILINDKRFKIELDRIQCIENDLKKALNHCLSGREAFALSKKDFTETSLKIIENYRQKEALLNMIDSLQSIKKLFQSIEHIEYLLRFEKNFSDAIDLYDEKYELMEELAKKYHCVAKMRIKLIDSLQMVDDRMDSVLKRMVQHFCLKTFIQLCKAYSQIGKFEAAINQLLLHFADVIHDKAFSIVLGYVKLFTQEHLSPKNCSTPRKTSISDDKKSQNKSTNLQQKTFTELCQCLNIESFLQCLTDLCRAFWRMMDNYHQIFLFFKHKKFHQDANLQAQQIEFAIEKLSQGFLNVWSDIQHKIRVVVSSVRFVQLSNDSDAMIVKNDSNPCPSIDHQQDQLLLSFEEFIKILTVCEQMMEIGEQFCRANKDKDCTSLSMPNGVSNELQNTLYRQTRAYFQSYHHVSMSELRIFLENEIWTRCPIETSNEFELIANLQEFFFMKNCLLKISNRNKRETKKSSARNDSISSISSTTSSSLLFHSPFSSRNLQNYFQDKIFYRNDEDDSLDDSSISVSLSTPFDEIMIQQVAQQQIDDSATFLELFDYYFYTIYQFFSLDSLNFNWLRSFDSNLKEIIINNNDDDDRKSNQSLSSITATVGSQNQTKLLLSNHFSSFIRRINESLILNDNDSVANRSNESSPLKQSKDLIKNIKYSSPILPDYVTIDSPDNHYALGERIVAIQSLIFLARQFYNLCPFLLEFLRYENSLAECDQSANLDRKKLTEDGFKHLQFYHDKMYDNVESLQYQCLFAVATKLLSFESIIQQMSQIKWDLKEITSLHSSYVNVFIKEFIDFDLKYRKLLIKNDLECLVPNLHSETKPLSSTSNAIDIETPSMKLSSLSKRINLVLWDCILKIANRTFIEGFSYAKRCTNEGRALMQLDYEQFLSNIEKILSPYHKAVKSNSSKTLKNYLSNEKSIVEEFVKTFYVNEQSLLEWIQQRPNYTAKQLVSLINCIAIDNKKLKNSLLAAIDATTSVDRNNTSSNLNQSD